MQIVLPPRQLDLPARQLVLPARQLALPARQLALPAGLVSDFRATVKTSRKNSVGFYREKKIVLEHDYACELSCEHASSQGRAQCIHPSIHSPTYRFAISQE